MGADCRKWTLKFQAWIWYGCYYRLFTGLLYRLEVMRGKVRHMKGNIHGILTGYFFECALYEEEG